MKYTHQMALSGLLIALLPAAGCSKKPVTPEGPAKPSIPVAAQAATGMLFKESLDLQGSVVSENYALVPAKTGGTIEELLVKEGDAVQRDAPLCRLETDKLLRLLETRKQELAVARSSLAVARAQVEQAATSRDLAAKDYERYRKLSADEAVAVRQLDVAESQWKNAEAAHRVTEAQVDLAEARVKQAQAALAIAEQDLADATVRAPIAGFISLSYRELGEMVEAGKPVFRIDSPETIEISAFVPAAYYNRVVPGTTPIQVQVNGHDLGALPITYRSPTADESLRTFEIKARLANPPAGVVAGSMADVEVVLTTRQGMGVPASAILTRDGQPVVFVVQGAQARQQGVKTGLQTGGYVEILAGLPEMSAPVVVQGQDLLNDGDAVTVVEQ